MGACLGGRTNNASVTKRNSSADPTRPPSRAPSVSVVLCSYNGDRFIAAQIDSILTQTYPITELVVVDDASTDRTCRILGDLAATNARITIVRHQQNVGVNRSFQEALQLARGELIAMADQDDIWRREKIERMVAQFSPDAAMIYCDSVRFTADIPSHPRRNRKSRRIAGTDPRRLAIFNTVSGHAMIVRTSLVQRAMPIPAGVFYDWWLALVATTLGGIQFVDEILVYQRVHDANVTIPRKSSARERTARYREMLHEHLRCVARLEGLSQADAAFFRELCRNWNDSMRSRWNVRLFSFLMKHRTSLFAYKVRRWPWFSALKNSVRLSFTR